MSAKLAVQPAAKRDIIELVLWLEENASPRAAAETADRLEARIGQLRETPLIGAPRDDLGEGLRILIERPYVIVHRVSGGRVDVLGVLHGARDLPSLLR